MTRERDTKEIREIKLMRNMTAFISLSKTNKKKEQRFFFERKWILVINNEDVRWLIDCGGIFTTQVLVAGWNISFPQLFTFTESPWILVFFFFTPLHASPSILSIVLPYILRCFHSWNAKKVKNKKAWNGFGEGESREWIDRRTEGGIGRLTNCQLILFCASASISSVHGLS